MTNIVELPLIYNVMTLLWRHCNDISRKMSSSSLMSLFVFVQIYEWAIPILLTHLFLVFYFMQQSSVLVNYHYNNVIVIAIMILVFIGNVLSALCLNKVCRAKNSPYSLKLIEAEWRIYASVNLPSLVQIMACRLVGAKPLSKPVLENC